MNEEKLVEARNISRTYGDRRAVENISFSAKRGEITGFLGPNGAGKSTLMQIICGVLAASSGSVSIAGHDILDHPRKAKRHLGYLPEKPPVYPDCTVDEFLAYSARLRGLSAPALFDALAASKEKCGLNGAGKRLIGNLSKGFQQRVGIAQALVHSPDVIILDEPSSGLDPNQMIEIRELIREMGKDHCIILSTHILGEARDICDRVLIMRGGKVVMDADLAALDQGGERQSLIAAFHNPPASLGEITALEGVIEARPAGGRNRYRITYTGDPAVLSLIADTASSRNWGLIELANETDILEQTYIRLTGNQAADGLPWQ